MAKAIGNTDSIGEGTCMDHPVPLSVTVEFPEGITTFLVEGKPAINLACRGVASCGHEAIPKTGGMTIIDGSPAHRVGDTGELPGGGSYTLKTGAEGFKSN